jgi:hypothetical protein
MHVSANSREDVYPENNKEAPPKSCLGTKQNMENISKLLIVGLSMDNAGQSRRVTVINMQFNAYLLS